MYIVPSAGLGGAETFLRYLATLHRDYEPIFCFLRKGPLFDWMEHEGHRVFAQNFDVHLKNIPDVLRTLSWLRRTAKDCNVKLIHSTMSYGAIFGGLVSKSLKIPHVWFQHGPVKGWMTKLATSLPHDVVLVNSSYTREVQSVYSRGDSKLRLVQLGIPELFLEKVRMDNSEIVQSLRAELVDTLGLNHDSKLVAMVCRLDRGKGVHLLLEAFAKLVKRRGDKERVGLVLWGQSLDLENPYHAHLHSMSQGLPVCFAGPTEDVRSALQTSNILVSASVWPETFGFTIVEAMAVGTVAVAPREGGPLDIIEDGISGFLFEPRSSVELATVLQKIIDDHELAETTAREARKQVETRLRAENGVEQIEKIYGELL